jgi:hypothetical protein
LVVAADHVSARIVAALEGKICAKPPAVPSIASKPRS